MSDKMNNTKREWMKANKERLREYRRKYIKNFYEKLRNDPELRREYNLKKKRMYKEMQRKKFLELVSHELSESMTTFKIVIEGSI